MTTPLSPKCMQAHDTHALVCLCACLRVKIHGEFVVHHCTQPLVPFGHFVWTWSKCQSAVGSPSLNYQS